MQFYSSMKDMTYIIRAGWYEMQAGQRVFHRGLEAQFRKHQFDSETARRALGWTDEDHDHVVQALKDPAIGTGPYNDRMGGRLNVNLEAHPEEHNYGPGGEMVTIPPKPCLFTIVNAEGSALCSKPAEKGEDYCSEHLAAIRKQVAMAKARESKSTAGVA